MGHEAAPTWDLDAIYAGGVTGDAFRDELIALQHELPAFAERTAGLPRLVDAPDAWVETLTLVDDLTSRIGQLRSFAHCAWSADADSTPARLAAGIAAELFTALDAALVDVDAGLDEADHATFEAFLSREDVAPYAPFLRNLRARRHLRLPRAQQRLAVEMEREALHGWGNLYDLLSGKLRGRYVPPEGGPPRDVSIAELATLLGDGDEAVRHAAHEAGEGAWKDIEDQCAVALTHITGVRLGRQQHLGVDELEATLHRNRIERQTLHALWSACEAARPTLVRYLERKARLLGKARLDWWDLSAPLANGEGSIGWDKATRDVVESFRRFAPEMATFAQLAVDQRWIEAERRPGKRQGGYCTRLPLRQESRVFMTFGDTLRSTMTLAHELGHAYHNALLFELPPSRRHVTSATAETASTFAEALYRDHAFKAADSDALRLAMLDQELMAGVGLLMNINARFAFERQLYALRARGPFDPGQLTEVMVACQREAYGDALGSWSPMFWASKLHFYISHFGFYNWPYTFGYLFSTAVYTRALAEGPSFIPRYHELLQRTGYETAEAVGYGILGEDLTDVAFWQRATAPLLTRVHEFLDATAA